MNKTQLDLRKSANKMMQALAYDVCKQCIAEHGHVTRDVQVTIDKMLQNLVKQVPLQGIPLYWRYVKTYQLPNEHDKVFTKLTHLLQQVPAEVAYVLGEIYLEKFVLDHAPSSHLFSKALCMFDTCYQYTHDPVIMSYKAASLASTYARLGAQTLNAVFQSENGAKQVLKMIMEAYQFYLRDAYTPTLFTESYSQVDHVFLNTFQANLFHFAAREYKHVYGENDAQDSKPLVKQATPAVSIS